MKKTRELTAQKRLIEACRKNDLDAAKEAVSMDADVNTPDTKGFTPLRYAITAYLNNSKGLFTSAITIEEARDQLKVLIYLVRECGADINQPYNVYTSNKDKETENAEPEYLLHHFIKFGRSAGARVLVELGAQNKPNAGQEEALDTITSFKTGPFFNSASKDATLHLEVLKSLLEEQEAKQVSEAVGKAALDADGFDLAQGGGALATTKITEEEQLNSALEGLDLKPGDVPYAGVTTPEETN
jgi:hypothetical protein